MLDDRWDNLRVVIPVGPLQHHKEWLQEAIDSVLGQTILPGEILIIDDMSDITEADYHNAFMRHNGFGDYGISVSIWQNCWRMGVAACFNQGVMYYSPCEYTLMLGSDDTLEPFAIERAKDYIEMAEFVGKAGKTYFGFPIRYMDDNSEQNLPCNAAVVSKSLWRLTGGFPPEASAGACDALLLSCMIAHSPRAGFIQMIGKEPLYNVRRHEHTDTREHGGLWSELINIRNWATERWQPPQWGRM